VLLISQIRVYAFFVKEAMYCSVATKRLSTQLARKHPRKMPKSAVDGEKQDGPLTKKELSDGPQKNVSRAHHSSSVSDFR
jgi:hypothetical protein